MKPFLQNLSLSMASLAVCLVAIEIGLRLFNGVPLWPIENFIAKQTNQIKINQAVRYDALLGWHLLENRATGKGDQTTSIGEFGVRMNSSKLAPAPRNAILAVGDSFTSGSEVWDHQTWPAHLQRILGEPVVNAGAGGWGADHMLLNTERLIPIIKPHTIIFDLMIDDIERTEFEIYGGIYKPYFLVENGKLVHKNHPVPHYGGGPRELGWLRGVLGHSHLVNWTIDRVSNGTWWWRDWGNMYKKVDNDGAKVTCLLLDRLKKRTDAENIRLIAVLQFGSTHIRGWEKPVYDHVTVRKCAADMGIELVDFWEPLKNVMASNDGTFCSLFVNHDDKCKVLGHMSPEGNEFTARGIAAAIRRR